MKKIGLIIIALLLGSVFVYIVATSNSDELKICDGLDELNKLTRYNAEGYASYNSTHCEDWERLCDVYYFKQILASLGVSERFNSIIEPFITYPLFFYIERNCYECGRYVCRNYYTRQMLECTELDRGLREFIEFLIYASECKCSECIKVQSGLNFSKRD